MSCFSPKATIVLVHGAWADGSCWQQVILPLRKEGLQVTCTPLADIALERHSGPPTRC